MYVWFGMIPACYLHIQFNTSSLMLLSIKEKITIPQKIHYHYDTNIFLGNRLSQQSQSCIYRSKQVPHTNGNNPETGDYML